MRQILLSSPLHPASQSLVAALVLVALVVMAGYWLSNGGHRGGLIDIDRAAPLSITFQVDINTADWPELAQLPDIGETLARRIVQSRQQEGPFRRHADLDRVRGIGPKLLARIEPYLLPIETGGNSRRDGAATGLRAATNNE
jgi:competence protein ComEA